MSYWDSSALVKLYVQEPDSPQFRTLALETGTVATGSLTWFEMRTVFGRREAGGVLPPGEAAVLAGELKADAAAGDLVIVLPSTTDLEREFGAVLDACFARVPRIFVRTNDALHLAVAKIAEESDFITADVRQREAAQVLGFTVLP